MVSDTRAWKQQACTLFEYEAEQERGLDAHEDLFNPLVLRFALNNGERATVIASTQPHRAEDAAVLQQRDDRAAGVVGYDISLWLRLRRRCERNDGLVGSMLTHRHSLHKRPA